MGFGSSLRTWSQCWGTNHVPIWVHNQHTNTHELLRWWAPPGIPKKYMLIGIIQGNYGSDHQTRQGLVSTITSPAFWNPRGDFGPSNQSNYRFNRSTPNFLTSDKTNKDHAKLVEVVGHPSEKYEFVNWDDDIPNINGKIKNGNQNHQPENYINTFPNLTGPRPFPWVPPVINVRAIISASSSWLLARRIKLMAWRQRRLCAWCVEVLTITYGGFHMVHNE